MIKYSHPNSEFRVDDDSAFMRSKLLRFFLGLLNIGGSTIIWIVSFICSGCIAAIIAVIVGYEKYSFPLAMIFLFLLFLYLEDKMRDKIRVLRLTPLRCSNCTRFMEVRSYELESVKDGVVFYECPYCKLYVDSGITIGD